MSKPDRENKLKRDHAALSIRRQCTLLSLARSGVYRERQGPDAEELALMRKIDELFLAHPFLGARRIAIMLREDGLRVNRKRVKRLMAVMGLQALGPKPRTSKKAKGMDWASRAVLAWRLSNTMDTGFCLEALDEALARYGQPEIFNTGQGSQFTSAAFTAKLQAHGIRISMDGRGRYLDNIFIERLWRSLKHENVYLMAYADGREARTGIGRWIGFYNDKRPHQALGYKTPMAVWRSAGAGCGHVDNANALPTGPQQQQQERAMAA
jgi:putative transposase